MRKVAQENGLPGEHLEDFAHDEKLAAIVLKQLLDVGRKGGLRGIELIDGVVLAEEEWTPENVSFYPSYAFTRKPKLTLRQGYTTSAQKINRKKILEKYKKGVEHAYQKAGN